MIGQAEEENFYQRDDTGSFSENLAVTQPFTGHEQGATDPGQDEIEGGRAGNGIQQKGGEKNCSTNLVGGTNNQGKVQQPIGAITNTTHGRVIGLFVWMFFRHVF